MKPRLYLETTIPSYLVARRSRDLRLAADQETTLQWWEAERHDYELFISQAVVTEVSQADANFASARLGYLRDISLLPRTPAASALIMHLLASGIISAAAEDDAAHIGLAAAHGMDFLLTWNCRHINNHHIRARIVRACAVFDLTMPDICTPAELMKQ
jgi:hypothetical protein